MLKLPHAVMRFLRDVYLLSVALCQPQPIPMRAPLRRASRGSSTTRP